MRFALLTGVNDNKIHGIVSSNDLESDDSEDIEFRFVAAYDFEERPELEFYTMLPNGSPFHLRIPAYWIKKEILKILAETPNAYPKDFVFPED